MSAWTYKVEEFDDDYVGYLIEDDQGQFVCLLMQSPNPRSDDIDAEATAKLIVDAVNAQAHAKPLSGDPSKLTLGDLTRALEAEPNAALKRAFVEVEAQREHVRETERARDIANANARSATQATLSVDWVCPGCSEYNRGAHPCWLCGRVRSC